MAGRPPKNREIKKLQGTLQPCRDKGPDVAFQKIIQWPPAPRELCTKGKKLYETTCSQLKLLGVLNEVNLAIVLAYATEMGKYFTTEKELARTKDNPTPRLQAVYDKNGTLLKYIRNPLDKMASEYLDNARKMANELGITPASQHKIKGVMTEQTQDEFEALSNKYDEEL
ncbi:P27 family phage terminase small subunit [Halosquirtibacter laminarini]|uniref:P27 family phage terminase small subunit n=1 Tax=Halosquirtibacter laminarini TaxID=3374600 RepID=A0AC61NPF4_9BACT|nr:P27 family phage terminase small subunit [Prolixibacteraceae bacterium]